MKIHDDKIIDNPNPGGGPSLGLISALGVISTLSSAELSATHMGLPRVPTPLFDEPIVDDDHVILRGELYWVDSMRHMFDVETEMTIGEWRALTGNENAGVIRRHDTKGRATFFSEKLNIKISRRESE